MSLLREINQLKKSGLKKTSTLVTKIDGQRYIEKKIDNSFHVNISLIKDYTLTPYVVDYDPDLHVGQIRPFLYIGSVDVAGDFNLLCQLGISHILNVTSSKLEYFPSTISNTENRFIYAHINFNDLPEVKLISKIESCIEFIESAKKFNKAAMFLKSNDCDNDCNNILKDNVSDERKEVYNSCKVLVHCMAGISRSAAVCIGYLIKTENISYEKAFDEVKMARPSIKPNIGFIDQLKKWAISD